MSDCFITRRGSKANLQPLTVTQNGVYTPAMGVDGFNSVGVNVPAEPDLEDITITQNGTYTHQGKDGYGIVIVNVSGGGGTSRLPQEYQELQYIQSTGSQIISTGITSDIDTALIVDMQVLTTQTGSVHGVAGGVPVGGNQSRCCVGFAVDQQKFYCAIGTQNNFIDSPNYLARHTLTVDLYNKKYGVDGDLSDYLPGVYEGGGDLVLFARRVNGDYDNYATCKFFSAIIKKSDVKVREFIPCYRKSDGVIGLYDIIGEAFYINSGSGAFLPGPPG